jgi:hypothetical protein
MQTPAYFEQETTAFVSHASHARAMRAHREDWAIAQDCWKLARAGH